MPVTTEVRVRYAETDQMGIVYYANYLVWFEIGRVELLRSLGLAYSQLEIDHQCILPVSRPVAAIAPRPATTMRF
jgi:acyl-CoA thioester hydrolase